MLTDSELREIRERLSASPNGDDRDDVGNACYEFVMEDAPRLFDEVTRLRQALARIEALDQTVHGLVIGHIAREALGVTRHD